MQECLPYNAIFTKEKKNNEQLSMTHMHISFKTKERQHMFHRENTKLVILIKKMILKNES